jgi:hypothetical protein
MRKYSVFAIFTFLLIAPMILQSAHAAGDSWYPGKGLKQGDYFSYTVCWTDWHNCAPLQMDFWVKNETSDGNGWNLVFATVDGSIVQKGIMTIGKITPDPTSFDSNISDYTAVYRSTVSWLDSFATKDSPKSFDVPAWGRTGSVGGQSVGPTTQQKVTVQAGTFNTWVLGWHKGVDNMIWVDPSVPFPVKAKVYVDIASGGSPPPDYTLDLLKMGNSQTEPDFLKTIYSTTTAGVNAACDTPNMEQDSVHDTLTTDSGSMIVEYRYSPSNPHDGCPIEYRLSFEKTFDQNQKYQNVQYDIFTVDDQGQKLSSVAQSKGRTALFAPVGDDDLKFVFKGNVPLTHVVIAALGTGPEGSLPDTSLAGIVKFDIKTQQSFGTPSGGNVTGMTMLTAKASDGTTVAVSTSGPVNGQPMTLTISFMDVDGNKIKHQNYAINVTQGSTSILSNSTGHTHTGDDTQTSVNLASSDPIDIQITLNGVGLPTADPSTWTGVKGETLSFTHVVPEFPLSSLMIMAIVVGLGILFVRTNPNISNIKL